ncbi:YlmC/YmxH family sporulation protein [Rubeoparvulum massiliense]|uniref:YlmC/YmxH family sporulation protein n=1 Tax=Rubeoparvulum massiliense TaxID=1631346 RepID=UPI00065E62CC|nr:YlmC/YmxH family sporulation protein [Rubeoparvulum massiliense]
MKLSDFQTKDVVNIIDGSRLGQIMDFEIDLQQGKIRAIILPKYAKRFGIFGSGEEVLIAWQNIVKVGKDVILVRLEQPIPPYDQRNEYPAI